MANFKQETVDPLDLDEYLDFNHGILSPSSSASSLSRGKSSQGPEISTPRANHAAMKQPQNQNAFAGPSHQYDLHKQTTGLPMGALANTIAATRATPFSMAAMNGGFGGFRNTEDVFDFNAMPAKAFGGPGDVDMDFDSPVDGFAPSRSNSDAGFVDPNAIGGQSEGSTPVRFWPGMHTQQAALAKQQQQQEILRQQQLKAMQQPQADPAHQRSSSRSAPAGKPTDPVVEERISRLLNQMRNGSVTSADGLPSSGGSQSHLQRSKKPEEDMDEDERLLASEEGKKLSSKERRQLRNKVSARAFRSRRKEYISQLEGEISGKGQENEDLRAENAALKAENARLTDLSKMLLASPAFSNFLNDLNANGMPAVMENMPSLQQQQPQQQPTHAQQGKGQAFKDANPRQQQLLLQQQQQQQQNMQMGMNTIRENDVDLSNLDANGSWGVGMDYGFDAQVFAVTELPQGPAVDQIDTGVLSGKTSDFVSSFSYSKKDMPVVAPVVAASTPKPVAPVVDETVDFDESNPAYALFAEDASALVDSTPIFGALPLEKAVASIELVVEAPEAVRDAEAATMARFESICARLDELSALVR